MEQIIPSVVSLSSLGLIIGALLAYASKVFYVEVDERIPRVMNILPGANCGVCGYAGCAAYAKSVVNDNAPINCCLVGGAATITDIAGILGKEVSDGAEKKVAYVLCQGTDCNAKKKYDYAGADDCLSVMRLAGGDKACSFGCIGLGTCVKYCPFGAISVKDGIAVVDEDKCTSCGICVAHCPKKVIEIVPQGSKVRVQCNSKDPGAKAKDTCAVACISCKLCEKNCPSDAIHVENNIAKVDYDKCTHCGICVEKCPKKCIINMVH